MFQFSKEDNKNVGVDYLKVTNKALMYITGLVVVKCVVCYSPLSSKIIFPLR